METFLNISNEQAFLSMVFGGFKVTEIAGINREFYLAEKLVRKKKRLSGGQNHEN